MEEQSSELEQQTLRGRARRRELNRLSQQASRASETPERRSLRLQGNRLREQASRASESPEQRSLRLQKNRLREQARRANARETEQNPTEPYFEKRQRQEDQGLAEQVQNGDRSTPKIVYVKGGGGTGKTVLFHDEEEKKGSEDDHQPPVVTRNIVYKEVFQNLEEPRR